MEIPKKDLELVKAFILRESQDFSRFRSSASMRLSEQQEAIGRRFEYIKSVLKVLQEKVRQLKGMRSLTLRSWGNSGISLRSLQLLYAFKGGDWTFHLCPCGVPGCGGFCLTEEVRKDAIGHSSSPDL